MDAILLLRVSFLASAASIIAARCIPALRDHFLAYGSRASADTKKEERQRKTTSLLETLSDVTVPHSWFTSFYIVCVSSCLFWASQVMLKTSIFHGLVQHVDSSAPSMTLDQVSVVWFMMLAQGTRRLYECLEISKPSSSRMWVGHWLVGVWFYLSVTVAIWIEGIPTLLAEDHGLDHLAFTTPSFRTFVSTLLFFLASGIQHDCHAYLASLKKYTLPVHPAFQRLVCPHYFAECIIYLALSFVSAPAGSTLNWTVACALVFVGVNLGITADGTKKWYEAKFGKESVSRRWKMIPFMY